ncbi:MAG: zinc-dependent peptidase [Pseudanabaena sp. M135S2SP2A07QC]|jgi:Mlc titration factor MtfA (ptsG expression regulator)|nr:zinc-dependent peptidase [Pseudanabaena sp. M090S1SP2A07QC]MCA6506506.1 zinc-dependent peptidase [Pseudanabaena sp. M172S2SP2A07QC]MCA6521001.1 zinc-dependent peptidase [Pseudanabaena sp. M051S1SP2A07QC]MCA6527609.1 zinc-dependent peptidase [Pseudanabaena sp. M179S2SP2A07QC]MCA6531790.1 zinc-dependent peptidase [Pseudanabaena sp. M125S2SP2A07QC]MCA6536014.1 zinc-dependent peptidase [Pseudanabaena sp. M176S2SP2A07QC]MCA6540436.1 zinc-dependent peptidase [Pseudanabaena sp. M037S2SP2A07QC]MC
MSFRSQIYATLIVRLPKHFQPLFTSLEPLLSTLTLATIFSVVVSVIAIGILCYPLLVKWQRDRLMAKQFPKSWLSIIESNLSIYKSLTSEQQKELLGYIQVFLKEKQFIGCLGLQITEEIKVTIAAIACLLLFGDRKTYFPNLRSVLVYPHAYIVNELIMNSYVVEERRVARLGESWTRDQLVLSWEQIQQDVLNWKDGHNVILHEFAHQLDQEDGQAEGVPILPRVLDYEVWKQVMSAEYLQLCDRVENGQKTVLDNYGATSPAEFFAVATETFFEKPKQLNQKHEVLYELLQRYYRLDPRQWQN